MLVLRTILTFLAWLGDGPKFMPSLAQGDHLGIDLPEANSLLSAKTGHPNVWKVLRLVPTAVLEKSSIRDLPSHTGA